jgi:hypothetical protein
MSIGTLDRNVTEMSSLFRRLQENSAKIGKHDDSPRLRDELQAEVRSLMELTQQTRSLLSAVSNREDPAFLSVQNRFNDVHTDMKQSLPRIVSALRDHPVQTSHQPRFADGGYTTGLLDQQQLDAQSDELDFLEQSVNKILVTMRELNYLFTSTLTELQRQRSHLTEIDTFVADSRGSMETGLAQLSTAEERQKDGMSCTCKIFVLVFVIAAVIAAVILVTIYV